MNSWNKLSIAALMRLTILASMNLLVVRLVGGWLIAMHPIFFLSMITIDLGLYAMMVYTGSLNWTLIGMMLGGSGAVLLVILMFGIGPRSFEYPGPFQPVTARVEWVVNRLRKPPPPNSRAGMVTPPSPFRFSWEYQSMIGYLVVDAAGLVLIACGGLTALAEKHVDTAAAGESTSS
jgi:hypothetical protein